MRMDGSLSCIFSILLHPLIVVALEKKSSMERSRPKYPPSRTSNICIAPLFILTISFCLSFIRDLIGNPIFGPLPEEIGDITTLCYLYPPPPYLPFPPLLRYKLPVFSINSVILMLGTSQVPVSVDQFLIPSNGCIT